MQPAPWAGTRPRANSASTLRWGDDARGSRRRAATARRGERTRRGADCPRVRSGAGQGTVASSNTRRFAPRAIQGWRVPTYRRGRPKPRQRHARAAGGRGGAHRCVCSQVCLKSPPRQGLRAKTPRVRSDEAAQRFLAAHPLPSVVEAVAASAVGSEVLAPVPRCFSWAWKVLVTQ